MSDPTLTLYHLDYCSFCHWVLREADELGVPLKLVEISAHPEARRLLLQARGRATVPVLHIHDGGAGTLLPESADIVRYLHAHADRYRQSA
ncbi:MAG: glutathione S-transferase [Myxococcota bacterium]|jgi:glutathione S-transferase